jgi:hypothetical protein
MAAGSGMTTTGASDTAIRWRRFDRLADTGFGSGAVARGV